MITSAQAVARLIAEQHPAGARVLAIGGDGLRAALRERGLTVVESADDDPAAVVQGYGGPELAWGRLGEAAIAVGRGAAWFASNTDMTIPGDRGILPGNGAAVEVVRTATRWMSEAPEPQIAGKPRPPMHREIDTAYGGAAAAGRRRPAGHRHRGRPRRRGRLAARTDRGDGRGRAAGRTARAPAGVRGAGSARTGAAAAGVDGGGCFGLRLRRVERPGGRGRTPAGGRGRGAGRAAGVVRARPGRLRGTGSCGLAADKALARLGL